ncbi:MAG: glycosyltransferase family 39 protein [Candidatus Methylomirabilis oxyfera]|nr:glycosyltransferase family 39 protein [Candidatus Methylomirabilis oxyfera]
MTAQPVDPVIDETSPVSLPYERWFLVAILILGVALRLHHITKPLGDHHSWRQTQTAMIAANLYLDGLNLWSPRVDFYCTEMCSETGLLVLEFPLYNALVALLYKIFGLHEFVGRLVSIAFSTLAALLLYRLARRISGPPVALFAAMYFVLSPISVFYGRAFMPESLMLCAGIGALLYFYDWLQDERGTTFIIAAIFAITAFVVKFPMIHIVIPMTYMAWAKHGRAVFRKKALALFLTLFLLPSAVWLYHSATSPNLDMSWLLSDVRLLRGKDLYRIMWERLGQDVLTSVGRGLFLLGLLLGLRKTEERVLDVWLGAAILYVLAVGMGNIVHDYYQLPLVPIAAIYIGKAISCLPQLPLRRFVWLPLMALLIIATGAESRRIVKPWYGEDIAGLYQFAETVKRTIPQGPPIMVSSSYVSFAPWDPRLLYAFRRKGWNIRPTSLRQSLEQPHNRKARHLVIYPTDGLDPALIAHLLTRYPIVAVQKTHMTGMVFDLGPLETQTQR